MLPRSTILKSFMTRTKKRRSDQHFVWGYVALLRMSSTISHASGSSLNCDHDLSEYVHRGVRGRILPTWFKAAWAAFCCRREEEKNKLVGLSRGTEVEAGIPVPLVPRRRLGRGCPAPRLLSPWRRAGGEAVKKEAVCDGDFLRDGSGDLTGDDTREGSQREAGPVTAICVCRRVVVGEELGDRKGGFDKKVGWRQR